MAREYLSPRDIAEELGVSRSRAYEIARECTRIVFGRTVRVNREDFEIWKRRHEEQPVGRVQADQGRARKLGAAPRGVSVAATSISRLPIVPRTKSRSA